MNIKIKNINIDIFGGSHEPEIGAFFSGIDEITKEDKESAEKMLKRRSANNNLWSTKRFENDDYEIEDNNGIYKLVIKNKNINNIDYDKICNTPRPSHADYVAYVRGENNIGGSIYSGRMTAPLCFIGGICKNKLKKNGISVNSYISSIGNIVLGSYRNSDVELNGINKETMEELENSEFPVIKNENIKNAFDLIKKTADSGNSIGGTIECIVNGVKAGQLGGALAEGLECEISRLIFAIPGVKGVSFGAGFEISKMTGSESNDPFFYNNKKDIRTKTNNSGGINGGISNGMPITLSVAFRPTPSIHMEQETIDLVKKENSTIMVGGKHDTCIVPRAVACIDSAVSIVVWALLSEYYNKKR